MLPKGEITRVLVIKGEALSREFVAAMRIALPDVPIVFYLWDAVDNVRGANSIVDYFDAVATFDPVDAARFGWHHRPLFSRFDPNAFLPTEKDFDWCFIGTLHSDRHRVIHRLRQTVLDPMRTCVFCYCPSSLILWIS